jgi:hypothetical protein
MNKGILLIAFGKRGYLRMAYNLAYSLKHFNPDLHVTLAVEEGMTGIHFHEWRIFDRVKLLTNADTTANGKIDPAKVKARMYHIGAEHYDQFLYLDVDAVAVQDVTPLLDHCISTGAGYLTEVIGKGKRDSTIPYSIWASNDTIWQWFDLAPDATLCGIQSSWAYFDTKKGKALGEAVWHYYKQDFPLSMLTHKWAGTLPDELLFQGAAAKLGIDPTLTGFGKRPIFFGHSGGTQPADIKKNYLLLSCYGNSGSRSLTKLQYLELYDLLMRNYKRAKGDQHGYKLREYCMGDKHANGRG